MRLYLLHFLCYIIGAEVCVKSQSSFQYSQITDSLFQSKQNIHHLSVEIDTVYSIDIGYAKTSLCKTSDIARNKNAVAAINGSFFDIENEGSVTYFEKNDIVISYTKKNNRLINGVIILSDNNEIKIDTFKSDQFYEKSDKEKFVIATGPVLLKDSILLKLPYNGFTRMRHPRTCLCKTKEAIVFIVIDGRNENADGMNLFEAQKYLLSLGCLDAINLDGGGSSTMWIINKGVVNYPSDGGEERPVSNALLIIKK